MGEKMTLASDYVHTLGLNESRVQVINPRIENICNPLYPGSTPLRHSACAASTADCLIGRLSMPDFR